MIAFRVLIPRGQTSEHLPQNWQYSSAFSSWSYEPFFKSMISFLKPAPDWKEETQVPEQLPQAMHTDIDGTFSSSASYAGDGLSWSISSSSWILNPKSVMLILCFSMDFLFQVLIYPECYFWSFICRLYDAFWACAWTCEKQTTIHVQICLINPACTKESVRSNPFINIR